jgi:uncharacterized SAM-dependent methyltransferase
LSPQEEGIFFQHIRACLTAGDYFLLGVDLRKDQAILQRAYNDDQGITAQFNRNILYHLNHKFHGNFNPEQFEHWAFYNQELHQIEMHLVSVVDQRVQLLRLGLEVTVLAQETIRTEISRKFALPELTKQLDGYGLPVQRVWQDAQGAPIRKTGDKSGFDYKSDWVQTISPIRSMVMNGTRFHIHS